MEAPFSQKMLVWYIPIKGEYFGTFWETLLLAHNAKNTSIQHCHIIITLHVLDTI